MHNANNFESYNYPNKQIEKKSFYVLLEKKSLMSGLILVWYEIKFTILTRKY